LFSFQSTGATYEFLGLSHARGRNPAAVKQLPGQGPHGACSRTL